MCLILFAYRVHPKYKLIIAANRDEFYERPTAPAHFWEDHPQILAGRDLKQMGTWMGVTKEGSFAALTNYRDPKELTDGKRSRGELVGDFLKNSLHPKTYMEKVANHRDLYPGYNLLAGDAKDLYYYSNIGNELKRIDSGIYGVSNHLLNTEWPKVKRGKEGLEKIVKGNRNDLEEQLFTILQNANPAPDDALPKTGVSLEWERVLSPMFIKSDGYGTRSSTVLLMTDEEIHFTERVYTLDGMSENIFHINF
ncbi:NRDE family protein [Bacillus sp. 1NLA3E]|uniref:NRDE family protein n=1 Tax=Bacillus sp. 1NLA3E TaxID=666686 RepID=UPI000247EBA7|nr:NRDE family protein [Bacillus sp. 1NLA3E]AGK53417.1 hypothetical protein B1NLA3E_08275 [Bacillus sp. 1NLA3E]